MLDRFSYALWGQFDLVWAFSPHIKFLRLGYVGRVDFVVYNVAHGVLSAQGMSIYTAMNHRVNSLLPNIAIRVNHSEMGFERVSMQARTIDEHVHCKAPNHRKC